MSFYLGYLKVLTYLFYLALQGINMNAQDDMPADSPPMGWNSYNFFGAAVREDEVRDLW